MSLSPTSIARRVVRHRWLIPSVLAALYTLWGGGTVPALLQAAILLPMASVPTVAMAALVARFAAIPWFPDDLATHAVSYSVLLWLGFQKQRFAYILPPMLGLGLFIAHPKLVETAAYVWFGYLLIQIGLLVRNLWRMRGLQKDQLALLRNREDDIRRTERQRLARDLHDIIAHQLSAVALHSMSYQGASDPTELREGLTLIHRETRRSKAELAKLNHVLQGGAPADAEGALSAAELEELRHRLTSSGVTLDFSICAEPRKISGSVAATSRRILQELATNITKYADRGQRAALSITTEGGILGIRASNGLRHSASRLNHLSNGWGLAGLRERVELHGGEMTVSSDRNRWDVNIAIPLLSHERMADQT